MEQRPLRALRSYPTGAGCSPGSLHISLSRIFFVCAPGLDQYLLDSLSSSLLIYFFIWGEYIL